jgi:hypothetical protein
MGLLVPFYVKCVMNLIFYATNSQYSCKYKKLK